ncbi:MAG: hypothetical protein GY716_00610 [bacterium]|nr:hypothetical protein [bacterium]
MSERRETLFETLEPPRGGLAGLRTRIERAEHRSVRRRRLSLLAGTAAAALLVGWGAFLAGRPAPELPPEFDLARMSLGQLPRPVEPLTVPENARGEIAVQRVPLAGDDVVFYLVGSTRARDAVE